MPISVSIITASYNKARFISDTIESVLAQTYQHFEYIIVDDASTDSTTDIVKTFQKTDPRITLLEHKTNRGANICRNVGIHAAKGRYILFLDADDLIASTCLANRVAQMDALPSLDFCVFTMGVFKTRIGDCHSGNWTPDSSNPLKDFLQHKLPWSILQPLWKKEFLLQLKGFDEHFMRLQDVELNTRALLQTGVNYKTIVTVPDCYYRIDDSRKNYNPFTFLNRWVTSSLLFYHKFENLIPLNLQPCLIGTIYETYLQLLYHFKTKAITQEELRNLEQALLGGVKSLTPAKKKLLQLSKLYNLHIPRIPGINKVLKTALIHS